MTVQEKLSVLSMRASDLRTQRPSNGNPLGENLYWESLIVPVAGKALLSPDEHAKFEPPPLHPGDDRCWIRKLVAGVGGRSIVITSTI
jgi:hypothetical protein